MKKLLLVMLVPVLVLAMVSCGGNLETGTEVPEWLQGRWTTDATTGTTGACMILTANEATIFDGTMVTANSITAFRVEYKGPTDKAKVLAAANDDDKFSLTFIRIYDGVTCGTLNAIDLDISASPTVFEVDVANATTPGWKSGDMPYYELLFASILGKDPLAASANVEFTKTQ